MASTVDNRIVEMRLQNEQFEANAAKSMKTVENLNKSLNTLATDKSLDLSKAAKNDSLSFLAESVENIKGRFSALGIVAATTLQNIATDAYNAGRKFMSAFTTEPIYTGLQEYETQINAIQTILSNTRDKGTSLEQVNAALDELNHYADMTIYNFTEMTRNIGTFTAAGVDLDTSVAAIKGIANLAAISGSNSEQASRAMYQLSQAIASGVVNLQDWNSVVNAGMGGQVFQNALKETARAMGIYIDESKSFRESISTRDGSGWLTSEVLLETLKKFTGDLTEAELLQKGYTAEQAAAITAMGEDANNAATKVKTFSQLIDTLKEAAQSGWTQSWNTIIGDFDEAKTLFTDLSYRFSKIIEKSAEARNTMLDFWKLRGGRDDLIRALNNVLDGFTNISNTVKGAFQDIFPPMTGKKLAEITKSVADLTEKFKLSEEATTSLRELFKGLFSVLNIGKKLISAAFRSISPLFESFNGGSGFISKAATSLGQFLQNLDKNFFSMENINAVVERNQEAVRKAMNLVNTGLEKIRPGLEWLREHLIILKDKAVDVGKRISEELSKIDFKGIFEKGIAIAQENFGKLAAYLEKIDFKGLLTDIAEKGKEFFSKFEDFSFKNIIDGFKELEINADTIGDKLHDIWNKIAEAVNFVAEGIKKLISPFTELATPIGNAEKKASSFFQVLTMDDVRSAVETGGLAVLVVSISKMFKGITSIFDNAGDFVKKGGKFVEKLTKTLNDVSGVLKAYQTDIRANTLLKVAGAIAILGAVIAGLTLLPFEDLSNVVKLISGVATALVLVTGIFIKLTEAKEVAKDTSWISELLSPLQGVFDALQSKIKTGILINVAKTLIVFAGAMWVVAQIPADKLQSSLIAISIALGELAVVVGILNLTAKNVNSKAYSGMSFALAGISVSITLLLNAIKKLDGIDPKTLWLGLSTIAGLTAVLGAFFLIVDKNNFSMTQAIGVVAISAALLVMEKPLKEIGSLDVATISKGLLTIAALLLAVGAYAAMGNSGTQMIVNAAGILAISAAIKILGGVMTDLGFLDFDIIKNGLIGLGGLLAEVAISMKLMQGTISGAVVLAAVAAALMLLVPQFTSLAYLPLENIRNGLIALAGAFVIFGVAAYALQPVAPALAILGVALAAIIGTVALVIFAISSLVNSFDNFLDGMERLSTMSNAQIETMLDNFEHLFTGLSEKMPAITQAIGTMVAQIIVQIVLAIASMKAELINGGIVLLAGILEVLSRFAGPISEAVLVIIEAVLQAVRDHIYDITLLAVLIIAEFAKALGAGAEPILQAAVQLIVDLANGLGNTIRDQAGPLAEAIVNVVDALTVAIAEALKTAIYLMAPGLWDMCGQMLNKVKEFLGIHSPSTEGAEIGEYFALGVSEGMTDGNYVYSGASDMASQAIGGLSDMIPEFKIAGESGGTSFLEGFSSSFTNANPPVIESVSSITELISNQLPEMNTAGSEFGSAFSGSLIDQMNTDKPEILSTSHSMIEDFTEDGVDTVLHSAPQFESAAKSTMDSVVSGTNSKKSSYTSAIGNIMSSSVNKVESYEDDFYEAGTNMMEGLARGIESGGSSAIRAASDVASSALRAAQRELDINSPSKEFMWIGQMSDKGLAEGLRSFSYYATDAASTVSDEALEATKKSISKLGDISFEDYNVNPTITPVIDLSNVIAGSNTIDGMLNAPRQFSIETDKNYGLSDTLGAISGRLRENEITISAKADNVDNKIIETLQSLEGRMAQLGEAVSNMQIVMDTGALVGQISGPMDVSLGKRANLRKRGI